MLIDVDIHVSVYTYVICVFIRIYIYTYIQYLNRSFYVFQVCFLDYTSVWSPALD